MAGPGKPKGTPKPAGSGRAPGTPNKSTSEARHAIAAFVDNNAPRLQGWLDQVAQGIPMYDPKTGAPMLDKDGNMRWIVQPNPQKAFELLQSVVEYHVPKLARSEISGPNGAPLQIQAQSFRNLSEEELKQMELLANKATLALPE